MGRARGKNNATSKKQLRRQQRMQNLQDAGPAFASASAPTTPTPPASPTVIAGGAPLRSNPEEVPLVVYGEPDEGAVKQLRTCLSYGDALRGALLADHHLGYSQPIGAAIAYRNYVSPSGVGYDIGCGVKGVRTNIRAEDVDIARVMDEIVRRVSFGVGRKNNESVDHEVLDHIREAAFEGQRPMLDKAAEQLGTVGSGNHYVDLLTDDDGMLWVATHFGSRGFGHKTASGFLSLAQGASFDAHTPDGEMNSPPVLLDVRTDLGQAYIEAMNLAGEYAYAGRDTVVSTVLDILGGETTYEVHNHHNFATNEQHEGEDVWTIRKGCTPAFPGQQGFVGGSMGDASVVLEGMDSDTSAETLYSTIHGAGRAMSRTKAAGKWRKKWFCGHVGCRTVLQPPPANQPLGPGACSKHPAAQPRKVRAREGGAIDWQATKRDLDAQGIVLRGAGADEAPGAYKRIEEVVAAHRGQVRTLHTLRPLGVAMAAPDTFDPYKD